MASCPWKEDNGLLRIGLQTRSIPRDQLPPSNFVFLLDVSGSMRSSLKLPLLKQGFQRFVTEGLRDDDRVAIVTYASTAEVRLGSTLGSESEAILTVVEGLTAGGSTAGGAGIQTAYQIAEENFIAGGNNRVILATDGDFNVGVSTVEELEALIANKRESNVFLTVLGFGTGNIKDNRMQTLAEKGNGNYHYIDSEEEAEKVLLHGLGNLFTIAKNVKIQVEFNPEWVRAYRLIGYESRLLNPEEFDDDAVDSGDLGAGHSVTTLYEIEWTETPGFSESVPIAEMKSRYMLPEGSESQLDTQVVAPAYFPIGESSLDFQFATAVAMWGQIMRTSSYAEHMSLDDIIELAMAGKGEDTRGYRGEFIELVTSYQHLE
jgi:Ca-activated chloride channel family protein